MSNAIIQSAQRLSLIQKRLVMIGVSKINPTAKRLPAKAIKITAEEYAETFGIETNHAYEELKKAITGVLTKTVRQTLYGSKGPVYRQYTWLALADYAKGEGYVAIKFNAEISPYLVNLKKKFTSYKLAQAGAMRSIYAWRMLENFERFANDGKGFWRVNLEDFHFLMETPPSLRKNYADLNKRVIKPSINELEIDKNWLIKFKTIKRGRKVSELYFEFERNPQGQFGF